MLLSEQFSTKCSFYTVECSEPTRGLMTPKVEHSKPTRGLVMPKVERSEPTRALATETIVNNHWMMQLEFWRTMNWSENNGWDSDVSRQRYV